MYDVEYDIVFNGIFASEFGVLVKKRPDIPAPKKRSDVIEVSGMDGSVISSDDCYEDIEITVQLNYYTKDDLWSEVYRNVKRWLLSNGNNELILSDDPDFFYKVKYVEIGTNERSSLCVGNFSVKFTCDPFQYAISGKTQYCMKDVMYNAFDLSHPIIMVKGNGLCILEVNKNVFEVYVEEYIVINTEKMLTYKGDTLKNTAAVGNYEDLYLHHGINELSVSSGFDVEIIPNWRCL